MSGTFYVTTPIYYVNAKPHIGHAYTQVVADTLARFHRILGEDVFFLTGTDEYGEKIEEVSLAKYGEKGHEKEFVDSIVVKFREAWGSLNVSNDYFIRTTDPGHGKLVQDMLQGLWDKGEIEEGEYDGWFCTPCETFWTDTQAENGVCPECNRPLGRIKEKNYFFKMGKYREWLLEYINEHPTFIMPEFRRNEVLGFLREELTDLCISRPKERMSWGIELPFDKGYVVYVWFDALLNYVSGIGASGRERERFWPANFHLIAKDIIRHHAVYWPIMLKAMGLELPKTVFAHGWWKMGADKMSKSKGNVVDPLAFIEKYGVDPLRYFLIKAVKLGMDGSFSEDAFIATYNSDLANDLGNLLNRTLTMVEKYFDGVVPAAPRDPGDPAQLARSNELRSGIKGILPLVKGKMLSRDLLLQEALETVMQTVVGRANKYIEASAPWNYSKQGNMEAIKLIMADLVEALRVTAIAIAPFMPATADKMWRQLGAGDDIKADISPSVYDKWEPDKLAGVKVAKGEPLFMRIK
ncbi:MAG: methionine--tRNA ligase [Candidatus Omnitrophica bacterium]|nr:methionine--tRNA ligase [Candidatus Omnitrophota bacterium]MDD5487642.1 methionine--tRNA ligase [Candidatus Omnitrophota bacterium]